MTPSMMRRALLAGGTMLLAGRTAAQQATTLRLYSANFEADAAMLASEVPSRTEGRYQIEQFIGFDALTAELGQETAAGGEHALLDGVHKGDLDLTTIASASATERFPEMQVLDVPFMFRHYPAWSPTGCPVYRDGFD
jgi:TRAP-type C4-dicarboxylate transport system substrate-binding protein